METGPLPWDWKFLNKDGVRKFGLWEKGIFFDDPRAIGGLNLLKKRLRVSLQVLVTAS